MGQTDNIIYLYSSSPSSSILSKDYCVTHKAWGEQSVPSTIYPASLRRQYKNVYLFIFSSFFPVLQFCSLFIIMIIPIITTKIMIDLHQIEQGVFAYNKVHRCRMSPPCQPSESTMLEYNAQCTPNALYSIFFCHFCVFFALKNV